MLFHPSSIGGTASPSGSVGIAGRRFTRSKRLPLDGDGVVLHAVSRIPRAFAAEQVP
ncbi:hypothetical protein [Haloplanus pelagicus]|uniref:hypothetical protein n=1 Tax=Haloplanus pelagicus TaxID=2949995 RepID=UPI00203F5D26|nr:hypothetical protein [Haloplanus sp. HW8-1]